MKKLMPITNNVAEIRELDSEDLTRFKSAQEDPPISLLKNLGVRGQQKVPKKIITTIRLSTDVLETFKATSDGWQTRIDLSLRQFLLEHPIAA